MPTGAPQPRRTARNLRFGEIAKRYGYVDDEQIEEALREQRLRSERGEKHMLLGLILLGLGHIDNAQLIDILRRYEQGETR